MGEGRVRFEGHTHFLDTGEVLVVPSELRFRTQQGLTDSLNDCGFTVEHVFGDWARGAVTMQSRLWCLLRGGD